MKMISPRRMDVKFKQVFRFGRHIYNIPYDIDWLTIYKSEQSHGPIMAFAAIVLAVIAIPFTMGWSLLGVLLAWRISKKETATIEVQFVDGVYVRGHTTNANEIRLAERHVVAPRPEQIQLAREQARPQKRKPKLKVVR